MTINEANKLQEGDEVYWNDPDDGLCSKWLLIETIDIEDGIAYILDCDGSYLECGVSELSF